MRKIPTSFQVMGHTINVEFRDDLLDEYEAWGLCLFHEHKIYLQTPLKELKISQSHLMSTFWHEYFHMALYCMGHTEMAMDEALVDQLGQAVHQFHKSKVH